MIDQVHRIWMISFRFESDCWYAPHRLEQLKFGISVKSHLSSVDHFVLLSMIVRCSKLKYIFCQLLSRLDTKHPVERVQDLHIEGSSSEVSMHIRSPAQDHFLARFGPFRYWWVHSVSLCIFLARQRYIVPSLNRFREHDSDAMIIRNGRGKAWHFSQFCETLSSLFLCPVRAKWQHANSTGQAEEATLVHIVSDLCRIYGQGSLSRSKQWSKSETKMCIEIPTIPLNGSWLVRMVYTSLRIDRIWTTSFFPLFTDLDRPETYLARDYQDEHSK